MQLLVSFGRDQKMSLMQQTLESVSELIGARENFKNLKGTGYVCGGKV
jgi:hypothetical protein